MTKKSLARRVANRLLAAIARSAPGATTLRPLLHRMRGVRISGTVFIGDDVYLENEYPECIELRDGAQVCLRSTLIAHTRGAGRIVLESNTFVGANTVITAAPGKTVTVGEGAVITALSVVSSDVPAGTLFGTERARPLASATVPLTMSTPYESFLAGLRPLRRK
jgi:acetyltransferase-like isoleucine patch superfamily enzyme